MNPVDAQNICSSCEQAIRHGSGRLANVPGLIKRIIRDKLWRERKVETGKVVRLNSLADLITRKPYEGWGESLDKVLALIKDDPEVLAMWREATKAQGRRNDLVDNITEVRPKGTSREYTVSRLSKERPDLFAQVKSGKLSANAAAIKAGWRKKKTPLEQLLYWWKKADSMEQQKFLKEVT